jgi:Ca2+-binding RTX toxin-like protein
LDPAFREVGLGFGAGEYRGWNAAFVTQDFARSGSTSFLTGVAYSDKDTDRFYDAGEGLGGLKVSAVGAAGTFTTTTMASGGYDLQLPAGTYTVTFSGPTIATKASQVTIGAKNIKLDLVNPGTLTSSSNLITGDSYGNILSGTSGADKIQGLAGNDHLNGGDGNDRVEGGSGNDVLYGGTGNDAVVGGIGKDSMYGDAGSDTFVFTAMADTTVGANRDVIRNWDSSDRLDVTAIDSNAGSSGNQDFVFVGLGTSDRNVAQGQIKYYHYGNNTYVVGNTNGDTAADFQIEIIGKHVISSDDFLGVW